MSRRRPQQRLGRDLRQISRWWSHPVFDAALSRSKHGPRAAGRRSGLAAKMSAYAFTAMRDFCGWVFIGPLQLVEAHY